MILFIAVISFQLQFKFGMSVSAIGQWQESIANTNHRTSIQQEIRENYLSAMNVNGFSAISSLQWAPYG
jgi:hypothetical protein